MYQVPIDAIPNQEFSVILDEQECVIHLYQTGRRLYIDLSVDGETIKQGAVCLPKVPLIRNTTFSGQLYFVDTLATEPYQQEPPTYEELNTRYLLIYLDADEVESLDG